MPNTEEVVISPKGSEPILRSLLKYRELVYFFTWREFKLRYKQASLGVFWVILQPVLLMLLVDFIIVQKLGANFGNDQVPSSALIFLGLVLWQLFESSFGNTISNFINNQALFKKLYFPRLIPAIAFMISRLLDFFIAFGALLIIALVTNIPFPWFTLALLVPAITVLLLTAYGAGLFLGALNVKYRDLKQIVPFMMRVMFFGTPIIWPLSRVDIDWQWIFYLNPAGAVIESMRRSWFDASSIDWHLLWLPVVTMVICLVLGIWMYKRREKDMVDIV